jgi:hypothetical protein
MSDSPRTTHKATGDDVPAVRQTAVLVIILASYLMIVLDISIVITALPKIRQRLAYSATELSWVQNAYTLAFGGLLRLGARAGDIVGRRRMFAQPWRQFRHVEGQIRLQVGDRALPTLTSSGAWERT